MKKGFLGLKGELDEVSSALKRLWPLWLVLAALAAHMYQVDQDHRAIVSLKASVDSLSVRSR